MGMDIVQGLPEWARGSIGILVCTEHLSRHPDARTTGMERKVALAHHSQTKGQTGRFNRTLVRSLGKDAESEPIDWDGMGWEDSLRADGLSQ